MGIVLFSAYEDRGAEIWELIREGARGIAYMLKGSRPERLRQALEDTRAGHVILDGDAAAGKPQLIRELRSKIVGLEVIPVRASSRMRRGSSPLPSIVRSM